MNTNFPDRHQTTETPAHCVFDDLRRRLAQEAACRRLTDLLESVNAMERARSVPEEFDLRFEEFVYRSEDYATAVRPFFPSLVAFLSSRGGDVENVPRRKDLLAKAGVSSRVA